VWRHGIIFWVPLELSAASRQLTPGVPDELAGIGRFPGTRRCFGANRNRAFADRSDSKTRDQEETVGIDRRRFSR